MSELQSRIQEGIDGKYKGLANGFNRLNNYIFGIQRKSIMLIGGQSGCFKTTLLDFMVQHAIQDAEAKGVSLNIFYNSFEIDRLTKMCNWLSVQIFIKYGRIIPPETIKGFGDNRLTSEEQEIVDSEVPFIDEMFNKIKWTFKPDNPTGLYNSIWKFMGDRGEFEYEDYTDPDGEVKKKIKSFIPKDPEEYNLMVTDHLYLVKKERGFDTKQNIDKFSEYQVETKNMFGFSFINLQQFNQGISSVDRLKYAGSDVSPQQSDFRDSTNPYSDSDICIGLLNPFKLNMDDCLGYDLTKLDKMVMLKIIKNRMSQDNIAIGLYPNPAAGRFDELPPSHKINYNEYK